MGEEIKDSVAFHNLGPSALPSWVWEQNQTHTDQANLSFREVASSLGCWKLHPRRGQGQMQAAQKLSPAAQVL